jgi:membrane protein DedA with SNARE-associated domain
MAIEAISARYGLAAIFGGAALEGETALVAGGLLAHQRLLPFVGVALAGAAGSFCADQLFFQLGRRCRDDPRVRRRAGRPAFARVLALLERHPIGFILSCRFLYGLRTVSPIAIGTSGVPVRSFVILNTLAATGWAFVFTAIGYGFGHGIEFAFGRLRSIEHVAVAIGAIFAIMLVIAVVLRRRRLTAMGQPAARHPR